MLTTTYALKIIGRDGMYTYGDAAATPELAKISRGNLIARDTDRLCIVARYTDGSVWTDSAGNSHIRVLSTVVVDAESTPRQWGVSK